MAVEVDALPEGALPAPLFYGSSHALSSNGNEVIITFLTLVPSPGEEALNKPVVSVSMPRGSAADLYIVLGTVLERLEADLGPIKTIYQMEQQAAK